MMIIKIFKQIVFIIISIVFLLPFSAVFAYSIPAPSNLQASVLGKNNGDAKVSLEWSGQAGLSYMITKVFPDGRTAQITIQNSPIDKDCIMKGGFFSDPLVEGGKTYTYKVKSFDSLMNYSAEAVITITIHLGDSVGCRGFTYLSATSTLKNFALNIDLNNSDNKMHELYIDNRLVKKTKKDKIKLWPIFGKTHEIKIKQQNTNTTNLISTAYACDLESKDQVSVVNKEYTGFIGKISLGLDNSLKFIKLFFNKTL